MKGVSEFLINWLHLCNLVRDRAEIQSLPYRPLDPPHHYHHQQHQEHFSLPRDYQTDSNVHHQVPQPPPRQQQQQGSRTSPPSIAADVYNSQQESKVAQEAWNEECIKGLLSYPPGAQRLMAMDALRVEQVQRLCQQARISDSIMQRYASEHRHTDKRVHFQKDSSAIIESESDIADSSDDPYLDADVEIVRQFGQATNMDKELIEMLDKNGGKASQKDGELENQESDDEKEAVLVISGNGTDFVESSDHVTLGDLERTEEDDSITEEEMEEALQFRTNSRDYLPQLVSAVLHSPRALTQVNGLDPVQKLRRLILTRCLEDANWGIELCWLLEAEVGRAWKTLFEHRQQTGRRLIVVLPAEKAAVLAQIGTEKRDAFNLLQDAEQATAYGYTLPPHEDVQHSFDQLPTRLPSSLSMRRCSHFGDTMHFVDRLSQISLDLQSVRTEHRDQCLVDALNEMNRRIRRRMVTKGDISMDVEDNRGPHEWPQIDDLTVDLLNYSVHFPLVPKTVVWPNGDKSNADTDKSKVGVMRVLNIVSNECRLLSSRERCPYMVHMEVVETGLDGSDARLYASGSRDVGTTLEEAMGMANRNLHQNVGFPGTHIPPELMAKLAQQNSMHGRSPLASEPNVIDAEYSVAESEQDSDDELSSVSSDVPRGGSQADDWLSYPSESVYTNPHDIVREQEYEELHQQMHHQQQQQQQQEQYQQPHHYQQEQQQHQPHHYQQQQQHYQQYGPPPPPLQQLAPAAPQYPNYTTRSGLLDKVFGPLWAEKCQQIRQASPYGKVKGWRLASFIMKAGEDIRREALVMQVIDKLNIWFKSDIPESHRPYLRPYTIMCVGGDAGMLECISDAKSVDEIKKQTDGFTSLRDYFVRAYGPPARTAGPPAYPQPQYPAMQPPPSASGLGIGSSATTFEKAQDNFLRSLVGYSLVCYILQIKDRHNANILMDREGHIMHIDFGFVLGDTPKMGKVPIFSERAPFKLSADFWEVLGGWNFHEGGLGVKFCKMFEVAFACASAHSEEIASIIESAVLNLTRNVDEARFIANSVRSRLRMRGKVDSVEQKTFVMDLVNAALTSWGTSTYDWLQKNMNGYQ